MIAGIYKAMKSILKEWQSLQKVLLTNSVWEVGEECLDFFMTKERSKRHSRNTL